MVCHGLSKVCMVCYGMSIVCIRFDVSFVWVYTKFLPGSCRSQPIVDANDVAKLLLALVFVLDGLGHGERERFNSRQVRLRDRVQDPFRPIIGAIQGYLRAYHMYRAEALTVREIQRLDTLSRDALEGLQKVFPYGVTYKNGTFRSFFCCEKPHSMTHWADNYATVGRIRTMSTQVTESRYKSSVKTKARKTNNQASFGGSLLQNNMEVEAAIEMARHLDETGLYWVWSEFGWFDPNQPNLEKFAWFESPKPESLSLIKV